eukprot:scaffold5248_cov123-Isochrysis_galbana.AAC.1
MKEMMLALDPVWKSVTPIYRSDSLGRLSNTSPGMGAPFLNRDAVASSLPRGGWWAGSDILSTGCGMARCAGFAQDEPRVDVPTFGESDGSSAMAAARPRPHLSTRVNKHVAAHVDVQGARQCYRGVRLASIRMWATSTWVMHLSTNIAIRSPDTNTRPSPAVFAASGTPCHPPRPYRTPIPDQPAMPPSSTPQKPLDELARPHGRLKRPGSAMLASTRPIM